MTKLCVFPLRHLCIHEQSMLSLRTCSFGKPQHLKKLTLRPMYRIAKLLNRILTDPLKSEIFVKVRQW